jgi:hypothetical protein
MQSVRAAPYEGTTDRRHDGLYRLGISMSSGRLDRRPMIAGPSTRSTDSTTIGSGGGGLRFVANAGSSVGNLT